MSAYEKLIIRLRAVPCAGMVLGVLSGAIMATAGLVTNLIPEVHPVEIVVFR